MKAWSIDDVKIEFSEGLINVKVIFKKKLLVELV